MHYDMKRMGTIIQGARISRGMTQTALADKIEVSLRTIIAIETGKRNPTFEVLYKIADATGASLNYLLLGTENSKKSRMKNNLLTSKTI